MVQDPSLMMACGKGGECLLCPLCFWRAEAEAGLVPYMLCISHAVVKSNSLNLDHALWWGG